MAKKNDKNNWLEVNLENELNSFKKVQQQKKEIFDELVVDENENSELRKKLTEQLHKELEQLEIKHNENVLEIENTYNEKKKELLEKTMVRHNSTAFELLNKHYERQRDILEKNQIDTLELDKAFHKQRRKLFISQTQNLLSAISNLVNAGEAQVNDIANTWSVINQGAHDYGRVVGLTASQIERLNEKTLSFWSDNDITYKFNVGLDEYYKTMGAYNKELGRAVALTNDSMVNLVSMKNVLGEEQAIKFTANLDKFGLDVDAAKELVENIVGDARRSGLVISNLSQNVADNLHLAQQYTFENGIEGLVKMAEKASAVKWNMQQTAAFAEKVSSVEGAIKTGAQLSVLGGPFAQFSNPMGMLYESLNDLEGLQDRIFAMFGSLGQWNKEKGTVDISVFNKQQIRAAASAMGLNYGDVINTIQSQARRNVVMDQIKGLGLGDNATELIANTAQIDRETGRAYVNYEGKKIFANEIKDSKDKDKILKYLETQANSQDENLRNIAQNTLGAKELAEAAVKEVMVDKADLYQYLGVTKNGVQDTVYAIEQTKAVLNQTNIILSTISSLVGVLARVGGFRGAFSNGIFTGGSSGVGAIGTFGRLGSYSNASSMIRTYGSAQAVRSAIRRTNIKNIASGVGTSALMVGGVVGGQLMDAQSDRLRDKGLHDDADNVNIGGSILSGAGMGATALSWLGGPGMLVGGIGGGIAGFFMGAKENNDLEKERIKNDRIKTHYQRISDVTGIFLKGEYTEDELFSMRGGKPAVGSNLLEKMEEYDPGVYEKLPLDRFGGGGLIKGNSHANGGTMVMAEGNEFIVNAESTQKNLPLLNAINDNTIKPTQLTGSTIKISSPNNSQHHIGFDNLNINMKGGLDLSLNGGYAQTINTNELLSNPSFISGIRDEIIKQVNYTTDKSFIKDKYYKKL